MRLNQYIASCGICSRREADKLIASGRVLVNGNLPSAGMQVTEEDLVQVDKKSIKAVVLEAPFSELGAQMETLLDRKSVV